MLKPSLTLLAIGLALSAAPASAQEASGPRPAAATAEARSVVASPRHALAQAAGFRALHYCTGLFSSGMSEALVEATAGGRRARSAALPMKIDREARTVSVSYSPDMEPRIAAWRPNLGCAQLPIGAKLGAVGNLAAWPADLVAPEFDARPWPLGDQNAVAKLRKPQAARLEQVLDQAFLGQAGAYKGATWGVVVIKDGKIVAERYGPGYGPHVLARTNSMCKSLAASLVGVGVRKGLIDLQKKAPLSEWARPGDPRGDITVNDLLHMASGLYTEAAGDPQQSLYMSGAAAAEVSALNMVDARPGSRFVYAGSDTILAVRALRQAVGDDHAFIRFPHRELMWKIGMTRTLVETDWNGDFLASGQCWSTARDFGRFGLLHLADGKWNGEQILPAGWAKYVSTPAPAQPPARATPGPAYGAQFWIYGGLEGLAPDAYSPGGALGQYAMIIPSKNVVVVRRGLDQGEGFRIAKFSTDVVAALGL